MLTTIKGIYDHGMIILAEEPPEKGDKGRCNYYVFAGAKCNCEI